MRLALLSALAEAPGPDSAGQGIAAGERPAFRRFAGKSVLSHQIDCAARLGCERVLCMASRLGPDLGASKAYAERAGLRFDIVDSLSRLAALVTADDDVLVISDGVLPDAAAAVSALARQPGVLAFPEEPALAMGFERIDATRAWSGMLRTRGDCVARLADLPSDSDPASALLRIALQSGARVIELDPLPVEESTWQRRVSRQGGGESERRWLTRQVRPASFAAIGTALAERMGLRWAHDAGGGRWGRAPHVTACVALALALVAALTRWPVVGLVFLLAFAAARVVAAIFDRVEAVGAARPAPGRALAIAGWLGDAVLVALLAQLLVTVPGWLGAVLGGLLVGLARLCEADSEDVRGAELLTFLGDRIPMIALLIALATTGWALPGVAALMLVALAALLWVHTARPARLTGD
ncbi:MAG: hypothetical protein JNJ92_11460 [Altererythrobacter sp.]|nr:hypothetical protein [Altererythrobacter sp.]